MMRAKPRLVTLITGMLPSGGRKCGDRGRHRRAERMRDALQQKPRDRKHAERQHDQDQKRNASRVDPEKQAVEAAVAAGLDRDVLVEEFADREPDQGRHQFDAAKREHDRRGNRERPHVGRQQDVGSWALIAAL